MEVAKKAEDDNLDTQVKVLDETIAPDELTKSHPLAEE